MSRTFWPAWALLALLPPGPVSPHGFASGSAGAGKQPRVTRTATRVYIHVPEGEYPNPQTGMNSCGANAGARFLQAYGLPISYEEFKQELRRSGSLIAGFNLGTPPAILAEAMSRHLPRVRVEQLAHGTRAERSASLAHLVSLLREGKPLVCLVGWGTKHQPEVAAPPGDPINSLHWVVVHGIDLRRQTVAVTDNGIRGEWSLVYFQNLLYWKPGLYTRLLLDRLGVQPGTIVY